MAKVPEILANMQFNLQWESSTLAEEWARNKKFAAYIDGRITSYGAGDAGGTNVVDPYSEQFLYNVQRSTRGDVDRAVASCTVSSKTWRTTIHHSNVLLKIASFVEKHSSMLAQAESLTRNVQLKDPRDYDVPALVRWLKYHQGWVTLSSTELGDREPYGVVAGITGPNTPLIALAWLVVPALAAGNAVCLHVSARDVMPAMLLAHICSEAGLPQGVLNVVPGGSDTINQLVKNKRIRKIACYGPIEFVRKIREQIAHFPLKRLSMVMTGKTPMLVFDDADLDSVTESAVKSAWYNQGSVPWSVKTLLIQESVFKTVVSKIKVRLLRIRIGSAFVKNADIGHPYRRQVLADIARVADHARSVGVEVFQTEDEPGEEFIVPTVLIGGNGLCNSITDCEIVPGIVAIPFRTAKEAVALANNSRYGFAASVWSDDQAAALEVADQLQVGTVWINSHGVFDPAVPMEGWKASGGNSFGGKSGFLDNLIKRQDSQPIAVQVRLPPPPLDSETPFVASDIPAKQAYKLFYGGAYKNANGNAIKTVYQDSKPCATFASASGEDVGKAVDAALRALPSWSSASPTHRAQVLYNMVSTLTSNSQQIISHLELIKDSTDSYFGVLDAKQTVTDALFRLNYWAAVCDKTTLSQAERSLAGGMSATVTREPLGVIAIGVYGLDNELRLFDELIWPSICYGNSVVLAVDATKPTGSLELFKAIGDALPAGVVNILTGDMSVLTSLASHQSVNGVFHFNLPDEMYLPVLTATLHNMKRICRISQEDFGVNHGPPAREFYELAMTQAKSIWFNKGDMFAN